MIDRLTSPEPVRAQGMAIAERVLTNVDRSPLYNRSELGSLRRVVKLATKAIEPRESQSHESPIAASRHWPPTTTVGRVSCGHPPRRHQATGATRLKTRRLQRLDVH